MSGDETEFSPCGPCMCSAAERQFLDKFRDQVLEWIRQETPKREHPEGQPEFISRRAAARILGVRTSRINELINEGSLILIPEGAHGKLSHRNVRDFTENLVHRHCNLRQGSGSSRNPSNG